MKNLITVVGILVAVIILPAAGSLEHNVSNSARLFSCLTVTPNSGLEFGLQADPESYVLTVSNAGTWGGYVSPSWIKINGSGTISSGGTADVTITASFPSGTHTVDGCTDIYTGTITFYGGSCGNVIVPVTYKVCKCC